MLSINISGRFTYVYSNYAFEKQFDKKTFTREVLTFEKDANKKLDLYWEKFRPVPLTSEESADYLRKICCKLRKNQNLTSTLLMLKATNLEILMLF